MAIPLAEPAIRPAIPAKEFAHTWINHLVVNAAGTMEAALLYIEYCPYHPETDDRYREGKREVREGLLEVLLNVPSAMAAYQAIQDCIPEVVAFAAAKQAALLNPPVVNAPPVTPPPSEPEPEPEEEAEGGEETQEG